MSKQDDDEAAERAKQRANWPVRKFRLGEEPSEDLSDELTPEQCLEMMWPMARDARLLAHGSIPDYKREDSPIRIIRLSGDQRSTT